MSMSEINIFWRDYKFFPYEKNLALREVERLLSPSMISDDNEKITVKASISPSNIEKLVYFSHAAFDECLIETEQNKAELKNNKKSKRQNTRYSVHGLHEYKGKFNPQIVKSLFNIYGVSKNSKILDPFCGSGTTLVESAHIGIKGVGTDINPLAVFIANTKIKSLGISWKKIKKDFDNLLCSFESARKNFKLLEKDSERLLYLKSWFPENVLHDIECLKFLCNKAEESENIFLVVVSNILRDYSYQEPKDLRIRRRKSPFPCISFIEELKSKMNSAITSIKDFQENFGTIESDNIAINVDITACDPTDISNDSIDFAITSPPYSTALPYIDTQRLSLVWLSMIEPNEIKILESSLVGSREYRIKNDQDSWNSSLLTNSDKLPKEVHSFCKMLLDKLGESDGFRKKAVPSLLYRYFAQMQSAFEKVKQKLKIGSHFALIVGHNHTTIGGMKTNINTPDLLVYIAKALDFELAENTRLEVYHRYGLNSLNSVDKESLIVFRKK